MLLMLWGVLVALFYIAVGLGILFIFSQIALLVSAMTCILLENFWAWFTHKPIPWNIFSGEESLIRVKRNKPIKKS